MVVDDQSKISFSVPQGTLVLSTGLMSVGGRRRLAVQPGGLTSGFALHLVITERQRRGCILDVRARNGLQTYDLDAVGS